jgi:RNA recognition motif-containing protein
MGRRLYVGNLPYSATDEDLNELFSRAGAVANVHVMRDQATGRRRRSTSSTNTRWMVARSS